MNFNKNVVLLVGGVGGAKLAFGLAQILPPERLTIIVNTGDDFWHYGLRICPDLDTIMYTLSGYVDKTNGWGVAEDSTHMLEMLANYGESPWFGLRDKDIATHLLRTEMGRNGHTLTEITQHLTKGLGIECTVLPMTDAPVATIVDTVEYGTLGFQVYFVKHRWQPTVKSISLDGLESASVNPILEQALKSADAIIIGPSNPWLSINPILSIPGMHELIAACDVPRIAVAPIVQGQAIKGPTAKIMAELNLTVSVDTVIGYYKDIINGFVYDERDGSITAENIRTVAFDTIMDTEEKRTALATHILRWLTDWT